MLYYLFPFSSFIALNFQQLWSVFPSFTDQEFTSSLDEKWSTQDEESAKNTWHIANVLLLLLSVLIIQLLGHNFIFNV